MSTSRTNSYIQSGRRRGCGRGSASKCSAGRGSLYTCAFTRAVPTRSRAFVTCALARARARAHARQQAVLALVLGHRRLVASGLAPHRAHVRLGPGPGGHAREVGGAERRGLGHLGHHHGHAEHVGLELHQPRVLHGAAVGLQLLEPRRPPPPPSPARRRPSGRRSPRAPRERGGRVPVPRVRPTIVPRAYGSQCGEPSPVNAGTRYTPSLPVERAGELLGLGRGFRSRRARRAATAPRRRSRRSPPRARSPRAPPRPRRPS